MKTFRTMLKTELKLSLRGVDMFIFAICVPIVVLVILGILYGNQPAYEGAEYTLLEQSFGALATISICAGGVMGLPLVISDYRNKGILKRYKVTPVSPFMILFVQVTIYTLYAVISLLLLYFTATFFFGYQFHGSLAVFLGGYLLMAGVISSILYFPMLIFSGATLPYEVMPAALQKIADILPLTQGIKLLKSASLGLPVNNMLVPLIVMCVIAIICIAVSLKCFKWE